jgi:lipopolysaccharide cholinephosphotransferase
MKELSLKEIQDVELRILLSFDSICQQNGFRYSLGGGSLLGAIRHKGFIPWDDDIDVMMPRPDYEMFLQFCFKHDIGYSLYTYENTKEYNGLFAKLSDPTTEIVDEVMRIPAEMGVNIDVFPVDGLGNSKREAERIFKRTSLKRELLNAVVWKRFFKSKTHSILIEPFRMILYIVSRFINPKRILRRVDKENLKHSFDGSSFAGCVCGSYREKEIMETACFEDYCSVVFEGNTLMAISSYDEYLSKHYGDYMKLPPESKRQTHHTYVAYRR